VPAPLRVAVIGAGIVGVCTTLALLAEGHRVTVIDPGPAGGEQAASYGNGAWLNPGSVVPMALPGLWRRVPSFLIDPLGPLAIRPAYLPQLSPWLLRFVRAGATVDRVRQTARALRPLIADTPLHHQALADAAGVGELIGHSGLLHVFPDRAAFDAEALAWQLRRENGVEWLELDAEALRREEPALDHRYTFGVLLPAGGHCRNPGAYVAALMAHALAQGATLLRSRAEGFRVDSGSLRAVITDGEDLPADRAVIAAGAWSHRLAASLGDPVPLETERGYHAVIPAPGLTPRRPIMPSDGKWAGTMTASGLRIAGQVELAGLAAAPNWQRAEILLRAARTTFPGLPQDADGVTVWMGHRPSVADGLPVIGPASGCGDVLHAFGHGHIGLAAAPGTARLVTDLMLERMPSIDPTPYRARRFGRGAALRRPAATAARQPAV
jgi:D-amino-acid dehydrogenase